jgi:predicted HicB family RNase H-like nuclease
MTKEQRSERSKHFSHLGVEIPRNQHDRIRAIAKSKEITISQLVRRALNEYLAKC